MTAQVQSVGLIGKKCGMTRIFNEDGKAVPVTVIEVLPNRVAQVKTVEQDGYPAVQVTTGSRKKSHLTKALIGHYAKANVEPGVGLWEFRLKADHTFAVGAALDVDVFKIGQYVDVSGVTKGKGYAGAVKRHHFRTQDATHGNSLSHRAPGSIGQRQTPGRVFKGKKMSGHLGNVKRTAMSQRIVQIDAGRHLIFVQGAIPGSTNAYVVIRPAAKK
jgi:large subunit ribosomal protein L3